MLEQNINVPDALTRPLRFGDPEQIAALKIIEKDIKEKEEVERLMLGGTLKNYQVTVSFSGDAEFVVQATCKRKARELAQESLGEEIKQRRHRSR